MQLQSKDIESSPDFELKDELTYEDVVPFVISNMKKRNMATMGFYLVNAVFLFLFFNIALDFKQAFVIGWSRILFFFIVGIILVPLPLVPIHELIHAFVYRLFGARKLRYGMNKSQFYFYVAADDHVTDFFTLLFVALSPMILISSGLIGLALFIKGPASLLLLSGLFSHGIMCIGDFAMLSYFLDEGPHDLYTFDKVDEKKAFFYKKVR